MNSTVKKMHLQHERLCPILVGVARWSGAMGGLRLHELPSGGGVEAPPRALVVILFAAGKVSEHALAFAPQWQPSVPQTAFVGIELHPGGGKTDAPAPPRTAAA